MAARKPLVIIDGVIQQLPSGDTLDAYTLDIDVVTMESGETSENIPAGAPVYVDSSGKVLRAQANALATSYVLGLARETLAPGATGPIQTDGVISLPSWADITGSASLTPGSRYFLDPDNPGKLTTTPPSTTGQTVVFVGTALSATDLEISIREPILL